MKKRMCTNGSESCSYSAIDGSAYSLVFLIGLLVNGAALWAFIAKLASWTDTHIYMLNLVLADFIFVLFLPFRIYDAFFCLPKTFLCTFLIFTHFINMYASMLTSTAISIYRYLCIRFPLHARSWRKKKEAAVTVCLLIWLFLFSIVVVFHKDNHPEHLWTCYERCKDNHLQPELVLFLSFGYLASLLIIVFCSSRIICMLMKEQNMSEEMKSIVGMVAPNLTVFLVCYTPIHVAFVVNFFTRVPLKWRTTYLPAHVYLQVSEFIASTNCCFDSFSFYFLLKRFYT